MTGLTHVAAGAAVGALLAGKGGAVLGAVASLVPDVDEPRSTIGSKIPVVSVLFKVLLGHRGLTHTVVFAVLLSGGAWALSPYLGLSPVKCALVALLAVASHVALDSLTPSGTRALWPLEARWAGPVRTGSLSELPITALLCGFLWLALTGR